MGSLSGVNSLIHWASHTDADRRRFETNPFRNVIRIGSGGFSLWYKFWYIYTYISRKFSNLTFNSQKAPTPRPYQRHMRCLLWVPWGKVTTRYHGLYSQTYLTLHMWTPNIQTPVSGLYAGGNGFFHCIYTRISWNWRFYIQKEILATKWPIYLHKCLTNPELPPWVLIIFLYISLWKLPAWPVIYTTINIKRVSWYSLQWGKSHLQLYLQR